MNKYLLLLLSIIIVIAVIGYKEEVHITSVTWDKNVREWSFGEKIFPPTYQPIEINSSRPFEKIYIDGSLDWSSKESGFTAMSPMDTNLFLRNWVYFIGQPHEIKICRSTFWGGDWCDTEILPEIKPSYSIRLKGIELISSEYEKTDPRSDNLAYILEGMDESICERSVQIYFIDGGSEWKNSKYVLDGNVPPRICGIYAFEVKEPLKEIAIINMSEKKQILWGIMKLNENNSSD